MKRIAIVALALSAIAAAQSERDPATRQDLLRKAELIMLSDQPIIPLYIGSNRELVSTRVHGWQPNPQAMHLSRYLSVDPAR